MQNCQKNPLVFSQPADFDSLLFYTLFTIILQIFPDSIKAKRQINNCKATDCCVIIKEQKPPLVAPERAISLSRRDKHEQTRRFHDLLHGTI